MKTNKQAVLQAITEQAMLPLFFYHDANVSLETVKTLYKAGVKVIEYTNRGPEALANFSLMKEIRDAEMTNLILGVGTVKTKQDAENFLRAGADFFVSPIINPEVAQVANEADLLYIPGCMTPSEIFLAQQHHASLIKLFPANILSQDFVCSVKELFPGQLFMASGGVEIDRDNLTSWFKSGVATVGIGSKLISKPILVDQLYDVLFRRTQHALELVQNVKNAVTKPPVEV